MATSFGAEAFRIVLLCSLWYTISSTNNVIGKKILTDFPFPVTVAMVQVVSTALYLSPTLRVWSVPPMKSLPKSSLLKLILPLSFGKAFAAITAHVSIWKVPVSYSHTGRLIKKKNNNNFTKIGSYYFNKHRRRTASGLIDWSESFKQF